MGDDRMIGLAELRQGERVGRRAVEDEEHLRVGLEQLAQARARLLRPRVVAVARHMTFGVGAHERFESLGTDAGIVVGGELLRHRPEAPATAAMTIRPADRGRQ